MNRLFLLLFLFLAGCNSQNKNKGTGEIKNNPGENSSNTNSISSLDGCYLSIFKNDTSTLKINSNNGLVYGKLTYKRFEKDSNTGIINGTIQDSLIIADYTFQSEGISSVRQVVFKISGNNLMEGHGEIIINRNGDSAKFKDPAHLKFQEDQVFVKKNCE
jgi:hypothetical protein